MLRQLLRTRCRVQGLIRTSTERPVQNGSLLSRHMWTMVCPSKNQRLKLPKPVLFQSSRLQHDDLHMTKEEKDVAAEKVLANLDPARQKKLDLIKLEYDVLQQSRLDVPENILPSDWLELLNLPSPSSRRRFYRYLVKTERKKKSAMMKKAKRALLKAEQIPKPEGGRAKKSNIIFPMYNNPAKLYRNNNVAHSMMFGPDVVIDLDFDDHMRDMDSSHLANQLFMGHRFNCEDPEPFHMIFANASSSNRTIQYMSKRCGFSLDKMMFTVTEKDYLDLYPKEKLVYLTPHTDKVLSKFSYDDIYIVGGLIDKAITKPLTFAKAKEQRIRTAKFPLDNYLIWEKGGKRLTIDQVIKILVTLKQSNCWKTALQHVPSRKVVRF
ncbi:mitochondrial ribonuclease P protein 1 homolog [Haliotis rubra]|uniref:mitochondrial ribonuclease P protein 1 homolog n=1 Tax=Haliotis rubra TaxID=36100 RepID=UPI001EE566BC|nr:mitochondrial ribonuclease P protein 1 homolog [Haliotis rubra]XP_046561169.1 mitochondrial ribonuclease P protein 1 homolog [Haliotis rubra]XP_046561170.1 mitochondrial ribonuclease P protein 1 homolog [Haliotis rubra]